MKTRADYIMAATGIIGCVVILIISFVTGEA